VIEAAAGQPYTYQVAAHDPDGVALVYLLYQAPAGMQINALSGLVTWSPTSQSPAQTPVVLCAYDTNGAYATQEYVISVASGNQAPIMGALPEIIEAKEGETIEFSIPAADPDGDALVYWADKLPPGAGFDPSTRVFTWTPDYDSAGTYEQLTFVVTDGINQISTGLSLIIAPADQPLTLVKPEDRNLREGDRLRFYLQGGDPDGDPVTFSSHLLPPGSFLDPETGLFEWTPDFYQAGVYEVPFRVSDERSTVSETMSITVLNANAAPVFDQFEGWVVYEGQVVALRATASDPDYPTYAPPYRRPDGSLLWMEGPYSPVTYTVDGLPDGATFDAHTTEFLWITDYEDAGLYTMTFTVTDDGDGTGLPLTATQEVSIEVLNLNQAPVIAEFDNLTVQKDQVLEWVVGAADPDGNPVTLYAISALEGYPLPDFVTFTDNGDGTGLFRFAPGAGDRGDHTLELLAIDDGDGGAENEMRADTFSFVVTVESENEAPVLEFVGDKLAVFDDLFELTMRASDLDQEPLTFSVTGLPDAAILTPGNVYGTATLNWTPAPADLGTYTVTFEVVDGGNGNAALVASGSEAITLIVREANAAPALVSPGNQTVAEGDALTLELSATDPDGDVLTYSAAGLPSGAVLDPIAGILTWTPTLLQAGLYEDVVLSVSDGQGSSSQTIAIEVSNTNMAPQLVSLPVLAGREGTLLEYTIVGADFDSDALVFAVVAGMPSGARFDNYTGQFSWTPGYEQAGTHSLTLAVYDPEGLSDTAQVELRIANVNRAPTVQTSDHWATLGQTLQFFVTASDPDADDVLSYSAHELPEGASFDASTGEFLWTPGPAQAGDYVLVLRVSDGTASASQAILIRAAVQPELPSVTIELTPSFPAIPGQSVWVHAIADSLADIRDLTVNIAGQSYELDDMGRVLIEALAPGKYLVEAVATDADGLTGQATALLKVRDPLDDSAPVVTLADELAHAILHSPTDVFGSVQDPGLDHWQLELAPFGSSDFVLLTTGENPVNDNALARIDPYLLPNGFYSLRLSARDLGRRTAQTETVIEINTATKPEAYQRTETDLSVDLGGVTVELHRTYDSLTRQQPGAFGYGWQFSNRQTGIQTNVPTTGREQFGLYNALREGTRLYLTLHTGQRSGFTFVPQRIDMPGVTYYLPAWRADPGVDYVLDSADAMLQKAGAHFYEQASGMPYHPDSPYFDGSDYSLSAPDGTQYLIDTQRGVIEEITPTGGHLYYADSGISTASGAAIQFIHDTQGRITRVHTPEGAGLVYQYDDTGNLVMVRDLATGQTTRYGYDPGDVHLLAAAVDNAGGEAISFNSPPVTTPIQTDLGGVGNFMGQITSDDLPADEVHSYAFSIQGSEIASTATGQLLLRISVESGDGSLNPAAPGIIGLAPLATQVTGPRAESLFALDKQGLYVLTLVGVDSSVAGAYELQVSVAGDINSDGLTDGLDSELMAAAQGTARGGPGYVPEADLDGSGLIDTADTQILIKNFGFIANRAPVINPDLPTYMTHEDLTVEIGLANVANDPDGDILFYRIVDAAHGSAALASNGQSIVFTPDAGYSGPASVTVLADDGFNLSEEARLVVTISDAPLLDFEIQNRLPRIDAGETYQLHILGDFADEADVPLIGTYVSYASSDPDVAGVSDTGLIGGFADGSATITASRGHLQAATAVGVGTPNDLYDMYVYDDGFKVYPETLSLPANGGVRQFSVKIDEDIDISAGATGTIYVVGNSLVISATEDGLVTAGEPGDTTLTIIHGPAEAVIPIRVETPQVGPVTLGPAGGVVQGSDGSIVQVAPGTLAEQTTVSITPLAESDLSLAIPDDFEYVAAFDLDIGDQELAAPVQLAIPVGGTVAPGTTVYFMREGTLPDETGQQQPIWFQDEIGIVGPDGIARTTSPPWRGMTRSAKLSIVQTLTEISMLKATFDAQTNAAIESLALSTLWCASAMTEDMPQAVLAVPSNTQTLHVVSVPVWGLPISTSIPVSLYPGQTTRISLPIIPITVPDVPQITTAALQLNNPPGSPIPDDYAPEFELVLHGYNFITSASTLHVAFKVGSGEPLEVQVVPTSATELRVGVPKSIILGLAEISVVRRPRGSVLMVRGYADLVSNRIYLTPETLPDNYAFSALGFRDTSSGTLSEVAVVNSNNEMVTRIPVAQAYTTGVANTWSVAATKDGTRAYVTLRLAGGVSVIDTMMLREIDIDPDPQNPSTVDYISLPTGAVPNQIVVGDKYAYVGDDVKNMVYVIDINPNSDKFHEVKKIPVSPAPAGIAGMALSSDGQRLYVAGRASPWTTFGMHMAHGKIIVIDTETNSQIRTGTIDLKIAPSGVTPTSDPSVILVTGIGGDQGTGVAYGMAVIKNGAVSHYVDIRWGWNEPDPWFGAYYGEAVAISPDNAYAFVAMTGHTVLNYVAPTVINRVTYIPVQVGGVDFRMRVDNSYVVDTNYYGPFGPMEPNGALIGIVNNPLDKNSAKLVAVTRPIPAPRGPDGVALSGDGKYLSASYPFNEAVFVYGLEAIEDAVTDSSNSGLLDNIPINDLENGQWAPDGNAAIDVKADYRIDPTDNPDLRPVFKTIDGSRAPIRTEGYPKGVSYQDRAITIGGGFGDIIEVDLKEELASIGFRGATDFSVGNSVERKDSFSGVKVAMWKDEVVRKDMLQNGTGGTSFGQSGLLYLYPEIDDELVEGLRRGEYPGTVLGWGKVYFKDASGTSHSLSLNIILSDYDGRSYSTSGPDMVVLHEKVGATGSSGSKFNLPLDVLRVQQRLKYLGFPAWGGQVWMDKWKTHDNQEETEIRHTWGNEDAEIKVNGKITDTDNADSTFQDNQDLTVEAIRLFQAVTAGGSPFKKTTSVDGSVSKDDPNTTTAIDWLNAQNAPRWMELIDPTDPTSLVWVLHVGQKFFIPNGGDFDIKPGRPRGDGPTDPHWGKHQQPERFGTSWAVKVIENATDNSPSQWINGISDRYSDTQNANGITSDPDPNEKNNSFEHAGHWAGLGIDVDIDQDRLDTEYAQQGIVDRIVDDGDLYWDANDRDFLKKTDGGYQGDYHVTPPGDGSSWVTWTFKGLKPGTYEVLVTWKQGDDLSEDVVYHMYDGPVANSVGHWESQPLSQRMAPQHYLRGDGKTAVTRQADATVENSKRWQSIKRDVYITTGTLTVQLKNDVWAVADAVKVVTAINHYDGPSIPDVRSRLSWYISNAGLTRTEKRVVQDIVYFWQAAVSQGTWLKVYVGGNPTKGQADYLRIRQVLDGVDDGRWKQYNYIPAVDPVQWRGTRNNSIIYAYPLDSHWHHFHVHLKPPVRQALTTGSIVTASTDVAHSLTQPELAPIKSHAVVRWQQSQVSGDGPASFENVHFEVSDLPDQTLALARDNTITVDRDAAGYGWFIDETPWDDDEFTDKVYDWELHADADSPAAGRIDLLTVLMHEVGHVLGLPDVPVGIDPTRLMTGMLAPGVRRLPSEFDFVYTPQVQETAEEEVSPEFHAVSYDDFMASLRQSERTDNDPDLVQHQEAYDPEDLHIGITDGTFTLEDPADPGFAWDMRGNTSVHSGQAVLDEGRFFFSGLSQSFIVPTGAQMLRFVIPSIALGASPGSPPDAFEVALLDAGTYESLVGVVRSLGQTDALLNIQSTGRTYVAPTVSIAGLSASGEIISLDGEIAVEIDLSAVPEGTAATLYFDLLGFAALDSQVTIDNVFILGDGPLPPIASDDAAETGIGRAVEIDVLANDFDLDGTIDPTTVVNVDGSGPERGSVEVDPLTGVVTYQPEPGYEGPDRFRYTVRDNDGYASNAAYVIMTVITTVGQPPTAVDDTYTVNEDSALIVEVPAGVLDNDSDPDGDSLSADLISDVSHGTLTFSTDGSFEYTPNPNYNGSDSFSYVAKDGMFDSNQAIVHLIVNAINDAPVASAASSVTDEDTAISIDLRSMVSDVETAPEDMSFVLGDPVACTVELQADGYTVVFSPAANHSGEASFTYSVTDTGDNGTAPITAGPAAISVEVMAVADRPSLTVEDAVGNEGSPISLAISASLVDMDGSETLSIYIGNVPTGATLSQGIDNGDGTWALMPSDLTGLTITVPDDRTLYLEVIASATEASNNDSESIAATLTATVANIAPSLIISGDAVADEGSMHTVTLGPVVDPGDDYVTECVVHWGDSTTDTYSGIGEVTHTYAEGPADYVIVVDLLDEDGIHSEAGSFALAVTNVAPVVSLDPIVEIEENGTATLTGTIADPGILDDFTLQINWGDPLSPNNAEIYAFGPNADGYQSFTLTHQYLDDNPTNTPTDPCTISVVIADKDDGVGEAVTEVQVNNVAPVITECRSSATVSSKAVEGQAVTVELRFVDVGTLDIHKVSIAWGDGEISQVSLISTDDMGVATDSHVYASGGIYEIEVTVEDDDTGLAQASTTAIVSGVGVHNGQLHVVGTDASDWVLIHVLYGGFNWQTFRYDGRERIRVYASLPNNMTIRDYDVTEVDRILVLLYGGSDVAMVSGMPSATLLLDGGSGDDMLFGSRGNSILLGGPGNDTLLGGGGYDILIGGTGRDTLIGGLGQGIFVGGQTVYDLESAVNPSANTEALLAILNEWSSAKPYDQRRDNILGIAPAPGRLNNGFFLRPGETILDDEKDDTIMGGPGQDLFPDLYHDLIYEGQLLFSSFWRLWLPF